MIDWLGVAFNALWIFGLAVLLTVVSFCRWYALDRSLPFREALDRPPWRSAVLVGFALMGVGLQYDVCHTWWERGLLSMVVVIVGYQIVRPVVTGRES